MLRLVLLNPTLNCWKSYKNGHARPSGFFLLGDGGSLPPQAKNSLIPPPRKIPPTKLLFPAHQKSIPPLNKSFQDITQQKPDKNIIFSCSHCSCTIFVLISYSFDTQVVLILILIDVQYLRNVVFSFEKGLIQQNHCSSVSHHPLTHPPSNISYPPHPLLVSGKPRWLLVLHLLPPLKLWCTVKM